MPICFVDDQTESLSSIEVTIISSLKWYTTTLQVLVPLSLNIDSFIDENGKHLSTTDDAMHIEWEGRGGGEVTVNDLEP